MNLEKFTDRAKGFLQSAQTVAIRMNHQRIGPEHLLKALLEDEQGMASGLIKAAGGDAATALRETDAALAKVACCNRRPERSRPPGWTMMPCACSIRPSKSRRRGATAMLPWNACCWLSRLPPRPRRGRLLATAGVKAEGLSAAINELRGGRTADTQSAEDRYDALKKFARDLTEVAREGQT